MVAKGKNQGGGFDPLNLVTDAVNIIDATHGGVTAQSPQKSAQDLTKQEQHYAPAPVKKALNATGNTLGAIGSVAAFLTSAQNWVRIGEVIAGLILLVMGLHQLAGGGPNIVVSGAKTAAKVVH